VSCVAPLFARVGLESGAIGEGVVNDDLNHKISLLREGLGRGQTVFDTSLLSTSGAFWDFGFSILKLNVSNFLSGVKHVKILVNAKMIA
jgi:hypothetical protein